MALRGTVAFFVVVLRAAGFGAAGCQLRATGMKTATKLSKT